MRDTKLSGYSLYKNLFLVLVFLFITANLSALSTAQWEYITSEHFTVSYTKSTAMHAEAVITCAENTLAVLADTLGFVPREKIAIVLKDDLDYSNGGTAILIPYIEIYCRFVPFKYRLQQDWLQTVVSHELSHYYSLRKFAPPLLWSADLGVYSYEVNTTVDIQFPVTGMDDFPTWFVEGIAQLGSYKFKADYRDPYREMILRDSFLNSKLLTLDAMSRFEGSSLDHELAYNQGFDFMLFLSGKYPDISIKMLCRSILINGFNAAFEKTYGWPLSSLYEEWLGTLAARYKNVSHTIAGTRLFANTSLLNMETAVADNGKYVLANWNSEDPDCKIFVRKADGAYAKLGNDVCYALKRDRETGHTWFNKEMYNPGTDTETYDIFQAAADGSVMRETRNSRSLCFDVLGGHLYYARYSGSSTDIVHRVPGGQETVLHTFGSNQSVHSLTVLEQGQILIITGEQSGALLLTENGLTPLWEGYHIIDPAYTGNGKILFVSTIDGTPQLYWTLLTGSNTWYKLTAAAGGVRYPSYENQAGGDTIYYSVYENGSFNLYRQSNPFQPGNGIRYKEFPGSTELNPLQGITPELRETGSSLIFYPAAISTELSLSGELFYTGEEKTINTLISLTTGLMNAPGNFNSAQKIILEVPFLLSGLEQYMTLLQADYLIYNFIQFPWIDFQLNYTLRSYFNTLIGNFPGYSGDTISLYYFNNIISAASDFSLVPGILRNTIGYDFYSTEYMDDGSSDYLSHSFYLQNYFDFHEAGLDLDYNLDWNLQKLGTGSAGYLPGNGFFTYNIYHWGIFNLFYAPMSDYHIDPARLGQDKFYLQAGARKYFALFPEDYNSPGSRMETYHLWNINGELQWRKLLQNRKLSFNLQLQGFSYLYVEDEQDPIYTLLPRINRYFGAYNSYSAAFTDLVKITAGISINPFVTAEKPTHWYEQMNLTLALEGGIAWYFTGDIGQYFIYNNKTLEKGYPLMANVSFSQLLYFNPAAPVSLDINFLYPVTTIGDTENYPTIIIELKK